MEWPFQERNTGRTRTDRDEVEHHRWADSDDEQNIRIQMINISKMLASQVIEVGEGFDGGNLHRNVDVDGIVDHNYSFSLGRRPLLGGIFRIREPYRTQFGGVGLLFEYPSVFFEAFQDELRRGQLDSKLARGVSEFGPLLEHTPNQFFAGLRLISGVLGSRWCCIFSYGRLP